MKRVVRDTNSTSESNTSTVYDVPDISNKYVSLETVLDWLDRLVEVKNNEANTSNN